MNKLVLAVFTILLAHLSFADNHAASQYSALDMYACSFNKGKDMDDLRALSGELDAWAKENSLTGSSYMLTPHTADLGDSDLDLVFLDRYKNHEDLGLAHIAWSEKSGKLRNKMAKIISCDSSWIMTGFAVAPDLQMEQEADSGTLTFWRCAFNDGQGWSQLAAADQRWLEHLKSEGIDLEGGLYRWWPGAGWSPQDDTDYVNVYVAKDMAMRGRTLHKMWSGLGGVREEIYSGISQCKYPSIWNVSAAGGSS